MGLCCWLLGKRKYSFVLGVGSRVSGKRSVLPPNLLTKTLSGDLRATSVSPSIRFPPANHERRQKTQNEHTSVKPRKLKNIYTVSMWRKRMKQVFRSSSFFWRSPVVEDKIQKVGCLLFLFFSGYTGTRLLSMTSFYMNKLLV